MKRPAMLERSLSRADVLDVCAVMLQRCDLTADELAAHMARPDLPGPKPNVAPATPVTRAAPTSDAPLTPRLIEVLDLCTSPEGSCVQDVQRALGIGMQTAFTYLDTLRVFSRLTWVKAPGIRAARYFSNPGHARAWLEGHTATGTAGSAEAQAAAAAKATHKATKEAALVASRIDIQARRDAAKTLAAMPVQPPVADTAPAPAPAPKKPPAENKPVGEATIPAHVVIQLGAPAVDTRLQVKPGDLLTAGFSTTKIGINPLTGKAWGQ